jgi:hypothetical protein
MLKTMDKNVKYDGPFVNLLMTHIFTTEEMIGCSATGKKGKTQQYRKPLDPIKKHFIKGKSLINIFRFKNCSLIINSLI